MTLPRRRRRSAARACTQTSRAPQETSARARPGRRRLIAAFCVWSGPGLAQGLNLIGRTPQGKIFSQASNGGSFDALQRPDDR